MAFTSFLPFLLILLCKVDSSNFVSQTKPHKPSLPCPQSNQAPKLFASFSEDKDQIRNILDLYFWTIPCENNLYFTNLGHEFKAAMKPGLYT